MAWQDLLLDASFKGMVFDCLAADDEIGRDIAFYEYPYKNGADTDDLGRRARQFSLTAVFWGTSYALLGQFLQLLEQPGPGELIHPTYGSFPAVQLLRHRVRQDAERPDFAQVRMQLVEHLDSTPLFSNTIPQLQQLQINAALVQAWSSSLGEFTDRLDALRTQATGGSYALLSRLSALRDLAGGVIGSLRATFPNVAFTSTTSDYTENPAAFGTDLVAGLDGLTANRAFSADSTTSDWRSMIMSANSVAAIPTQLSQGVVSASVTGESSVASTPIPVTPDDLALVDSVVSSGVAGDVLDTATQLLTDQVSTPTLAPDDIEQITDDARNMANLAIGKCRALDGSVDARPMTEPLKTAAAQLQTLAQTVLNARPPLVERQVAAAGNLHLVAFRWYGDYTRAAELLRLNNVRNPNDMRPGDVLRGYAT